MAPLRAIACAILLATTAPGFPANAPLGPGTASPAHLALARAAVGEEPDPGAVAAVKQVQGWLDATEGRLGDIVTSSTIAVPEIVPESDGGRRLVFKVTVSFNRAFYDRFHAWQRGWPAVPDMNSEGRIKSQLRRLNRYGVFLGLYSADGELIAKAPVVRNPYFANMLEDYYEDREGDLQPVPHSQAFKDRADALDPMLRAADLSAIAAPSLAERFVPVFQAEATTRKDVVLQVAPEDITRARTYRLVMEATDR